MSKKKKAVQPKVMTKHQLSRHEKAQRRQKIIFFSGIGIIAVIIILLFVGLLKEVVIPNQKTVLSVNDRSFDFGYYVDTLELYTQMSPSTQPSMLNSQLLSLIEQNEIIYRAAAMLDVTISDDDVKTRIEELDLKKSDAAMDLVRAEMLKEKLKDEYFGAQVPAAVPQVKMNTMLVESETIGRDIRDLIVANDDFQSLAKEHGLNYYSRNQYFGEYDWHPKEVYFDMLASNVPIDYAFSAAAGNVSQPLVDTETSKQLGYWLIRVNEHTFDPGVEEEGVPPTATADVTALLLASEVQARQVKDRLQAGEDIAALAAELSQYSTSKDNGGELGLLTKPATEGTYAVSETVDAHIFNEETALGVWSEPIKDTTFWTKGGAWMVQVVETSDSHELTEEDRATLISKKYNEWLTTVTSDTVTFVVEQSLTPEQQAAALEAVS